MSPAEGSQPFFKFQGEGAQPRFLVSLKVNFRAGGHGSSGSLPMPAYGHANDHKIIFGWLLRPPPCGTGNFLVDAH